MDCLNYFYRFLFYKKKTKPIRWEATTFHSSPDLKEAVLTVDVAQPLRSGDAYRKYKSWV